MKNPNGPSIEEKEGWQDELTDQEAERLLAPVSRSVSPSEQSQLDEAIRAIHTYLRCGCYGSVAKQARRVARLAAKLRKISQPK